MPRYIEEETFVNFVQEHFCNGCNNYNGVKCKSCSVDDAISFVESAPTAEVVARAEFDRVANELRRVEELYFAAQTREQGIKTIKIKVCSEQEAEIINKISKRYCPPSQNFGEDTNVPTKVKSGDICVVCGEPVPEGRQVCGMCEVGSKRLNRKKE